MSKKFVMKKSGIQETVPSEMQGAHMQSHTAAWQTVDLPPK